MKIQMLCPDVRFLPIYTPLLKLNWTIFQKIHYRFSNLIAVNYRQLSHISISIKNACKSEPKLTLLEKPTENWALCLCSYFLGIITLSQFCCDILWFLPQDRIGAKLLPKIATFDKSKAWKLLCAKRPSGTDHISNLPQKHLRFRIERNSFFHETPQTPNAKWKIMKLEQHS